MPLELLLDFVLDLLVLLHGVDADSDIRSSAHVITRSHDVS